MRYLFDTHTCSYVIHQRKGFESIARRMGGLRYGELVLSSIVLAELQFMVANSAVPQTKRQQSEGGTEALEAYLNTKIVTQVGT